MWCWWSVSCKGFPGHPRHLCTWIWQVACCLLVSLRSLIRHSAEPLNPWVKCDTSAIHMYLPILSNCIQSHFSEKSCMKENWSCTHTECGEAQSIKNENNAHVDCYKVWVMQIPWLHIVSLLLITLPSDILKISVDWAWMSLWLLSSLSVPKWK